MYKLWQIIVLLFCANSAILYPYCTAFGFPDSVVHPLMLSLIMTELIMLFDIIFNFLLAYEDEGSMQLVTSYKKIAHRYIFQGSFFQDLIIWLPLGQALMLLKPTLAILLLIKSVRFGQLIEFMDKKKVMPIIRSYFDQKTAKIVRDPELSEDWIQDHNQIRARMIASSMYNIIKLIVVIWIVAYMSGMLWCILLTF